MYSKKPKTKKNRNTKKHINKIIFISQSFPILIEKMHYAIIKQIHFEGKNVILFL